MEELEMLADIVINNVYSGLKTPMNFSLSEEQVISELVQRRNLALRKRAETGLVFTPDLYTTLKCISLVKKDTRECCELPEDCSKEVLHTKIPSLLMINQVKSVVYGGELGGMVPYRVVIGPNISSYFKSKYTRHVPTIWIDPDYNLWLFNSKVQKIKLTVLLEDYRQIEDSGCDCEGYKMPIPYWLSAELTRALTMDYITYYQRANPQPNTQSEILTPTK